jgi:serine protease AprX
MRRLLVCSALACAAIVTPTAASASLVNSTTTTAGKVQPALADALATASPTDKLTVFVHGTDAAAAKQAVLAAGLQPLTSWDRIKTAVGVGTPLQVQSAIANAAVTYVEVDRAITFNLDSSHKATRYDLARQSFTDPATGGPYDGTGFSIAINDSGIDGTHPMFQRADGTSKVVRNLKTVCHSVFSVFTDPSTFEPVDSCFVDVAANDTDTTSAGGHGTHVAGIAAGLPVTTTDGRKLYGAAPGADLIGLSVGASVSVYGGTQGLYWVLQHHDDPCAGNLTQVGLEDCPPIKVVNNSWGPVGGGEFNAQDAVSLIQDQLAAEGVVTVWANGNDGGDGTSNASNPPGQSPTPGVISVANYDDGGTGTRDNALDPSSSRGENGRPTTYPDVSAPGTNITSACRPYLTVCATGLDTADPNYNTISGTSMATPHIAGYVADLFQADPTLTPAEIEDVLEDTAYKFTAGAPYEADPRNTDNSTSFDKGHGLVDMAAALAEILGLPVPTGSGPTCDGTGVVTDPAGDANAVLGTSTPLPSEPALDVTSAWLTADASNDVTFHIKVVDLPDAPGGTNGEGEYFDFNFTYGGAGLYVSAARTLSGGEQFDLGRLGTTGRETLATLTGSFDPATDEISINLPASKMSPVVTEGSQFAGLNVVSRRELGVLIPDADSADGSCPFVVGSGVVVPTNTAPVAAASFGPAAPRPGETVAFDGTGSSDADNDALTYAWDFGDGATGAGATAQHVYAATGSFTATLTVTDGEGATSSASVPVTVVSDAAPTAAFTSSSASPKAKTPVTFDGSGSSDPDGDTLSYSWQFGDGTTATGAIVDHVFAKSGKYTVTLTVADGLGGSDTETLAIRVKG